MSAERRRIWSELVPSGELCSPPVLRMLSSRSIDLLVAVTPEQLDEAPAAVAACHDHGVGIGVWPMLDDDDGRWASVGNAELFRDYVLRVLDTLDGAGQRPDEIVIDLEPPIRKLRAVLGGQLGEGWRPPPLLEAAGEIYTDLVEQIGARGIDMSAAAVPMVVADRPGQAPGWQRLLGTPVDMPAFRRVEVMLYTTLIEGYARGVLQRQQARELLGALARATRERFGEEAGVSLGLVGGGALGSERPYRTVAELSDDVAVARAAGITHLSLHGLGGVLLRSPAEQWLDAFVETPAARSVPEPSLRTRALMGSVRFASRPLDVMCRLLSRGKT